MRLKSIELSGFKSFAKKTTLEFGAAVTAVVGPNGSGKSNIAESFRFVLGEQSMKSMRGKRGEDLIWNGSSSSPRAGRASVKLIFDNRDRGLNLDFDEVTIERVVNRTGVNEYLLNGSVVRLRDIAELLAGANIGASGHHIISQGEADRILSSSVKERREMVEDALGLTAFLYKREEAERKLEKTAENIREVEGLRRELTPHLKFLGTQVRKIEEAEALRTDLLEKYQDYFKRESIYIKIARAELSSQQTGPQQELARLNRSIETLRSALARKEGGDAFSKELVALEEEGRKAISRRGEVARELGRVEGGLAAQTAALRVSSDTVPGSQAREFGERVEREVAAMETLEGVALKNRLKALAVLAQEFLRRVAQGGGARADDHGLESRKHALEAELIELTGEEERVVRAIAALRAKIDSQKDQSRESERELFAAMSRRSELEHTLGGLRTKEELLTREEADFKRDVGEAAALLGREVTEYEAHGTLEADVAAEDREHQVERRRKLERLKIRLEESGSAGSSEILKEFKETSERDQFLSRELADLGASMESLRGLIDDLTKTLEVRFGEGIEKINKEFDAFFKLMFGGGQAALQLIREKKLKRGVGAAEDEEKKMSGDEEDVEVQEGVDIAVSLPHKRVKGLHMLSGGERALTSIALIFAMSQVNPPPFIILDETDAALDEANSRRYGDMIETLAKHSQLIVITHNRETMSRAGILYGITMGSDGVSKLLSVKFEEALAVAK